jgi:arylformamidase
MPCPDLGHIHCLAGALESPEFLRQNALLQAAWGKKVVPTTESLPKEDHFSILSQFRHWDSRVMQLVRQMVSD